MTERREAYFRSQLNWVHSVDHWLHPANSMVWESCLPFNGRKAEKDKWRSLNKNALVQILPSINCPYEPDPPSPNVKHLECILCFTITLGHLLPKALFPLHYEKCIWSISKSHQRPNNFKVAELSKFKDSETKGKFLVVSPFKYKKESASCASPAVEHRWADI